MLDKSGSDTLTYDEILSHKLGLGKFQMLNFFILGMVNFIDGSELVLVYMLNPILMKEWDLSMFYVEILSSALALGLLIGTVSSAYFADNFGRKSTMIAATFFLFLIILIVGVLVQDVYQMIFARFCSGIAQGITLPLSYVFISEIMPLEIRGRANIVPVAFELFGIAVIYVVAYNVLDSIDEGNWRAVVLAQTIPCIIACLGNIFILKESARYLLAKGQIKEAVQIIDEIGYINHMQEYQPINEIEYIKLDLWQSKTFGSRRQNNAKLKDLFNEQNRQITPKLWAIGFFMNFLAFGILFILPFLLLDMEMGLIELGIVQVGQGIALIPVYYTIDKPYIGRKMSLYVSYFIISVINLAVFLIQNEQYVIFVVAITLFFIRVGYQNSNVLVVESYQTTYRALGAGYYWGIQKFGGVLIPFIIPIFSDINMFLPFLVFAFIAAPLCYIAYIYPIDLTNQAMDEDYLQYQNEGDEEERKSLYQPNQDIKSLMGEDDDMNQQLNDKNLQQNQSYNSNSFLNDYFDKKDD